LNYSDDNIFSTFHNGSTFHGDQTGEVLAVTEMKRTKLETYERSFETQSGFLVLVKPEGKHYSLSFKRQIGTPPISSVLLTADEAKRLSNFLEPGYDAVASGFQSGEDGDVQYSQFTHLLPKYDGKSNTGGLLPLIIGTMTLFAVIAVIAYQIKFHHGL
jgi:hypothetical protein